MIDVKLAHSGRLFDLYEITNQGNSLVEEFIHSLSKKDAKKINALLNRSADAGLPKNDERFKQLKCKEINLYEFKSKPVRIFCTLEGQRKIILSNGFSKKTEGTPPNEIERAVRLLKGYFERGKK